MAYFDFDTIVALCTPSGSGAVALIRLSGKQACSIATRMSVLSGGKAIDTVPTHTIHYGSVVDADTSAVDNVLFFVMHGPRTFTGEHVVEITCHNNPFIINAIITRAITCGARMAQNGEFTRRAVLNGKMDMVQAESLHELITAGTQQALKRSLAQLQGSFSHILAGVEKQLTKALALSEASFEFIDEEDMHFGVQIKKSIDTVLATLVETQKSFAVQQQIRDGVRVTLIGSVNAGKSSLFNALLAQDRAIVTSIAGTTRDVIQAGMYRDGVHITLVDTAGLRQTDDVIESHGIKRSYQEAHKADVVLLICDSSRDITVQERAVYDELLQKYAHKTVLVHTKNDIKKYDHNVHDTCTRVVVSAVQKNNIDLLEQTIMQTVQDLLHKADAPFLLNKRQYTLVSALQKQLHVIGEMVSSNSIAYELVSHHLQEAIAQLAELTGKTISEASMDMIFKEFCVGK